MLFLTYILGFIIARKISYLPRELVFQAKVMMAAALEEQHNVD